ncbi:hypothetical protein GJ633_04045 [Halorubrum sp. CBA1125]|uniref:hypothetical protein n=1 Tax=Halorubrum sp. CBA1125 TaxID=2668072 RepID=UPI0012E8684A|nr:hypothetical protein [Halorubrum sp. CBA1125]MUW13923.1 hypothetical protein [Halorubrum sp. CBA1125]
MDLSTPPYTDEMARLAVDGSDVAVAEANQANAADVATSAENADALGGYEPSHFETPGSTDETGFAGGYDQQINESGTLAESETLTLDFSFSEALIDAVRWAAQFDESDVYVTDVSAGAASFNPGGDSGTKNIQPQTASNGSVTIENGYDVSTQDYTITVSVHLVSSGIHSHPI